MDLIKIAEEAFATKKELPSFKSGDTITVATVSKRVTKSVSSSIAVLLSVSPVTATKNVSQFVRCLRT